MIVPVPASLALALAPRVVWVTNPSCERCVRSRSVPVLDQMTQITRDKVEGEPVLEYDDELSTVQISDPYFAFYLRWGEGGVAGAP